jgi:outer membrane protein|tara:strand:+ start:353 stop:850 length:498 start_codon:yes stop_codon:yes gene_type:complete
MKQFIFISCLLAGLSFGANAQKFGHLDAQSLIMDMSVLADIEVKLQTAAQVYEAQIQSMQADLQTKNTEYQAKAATWPEAIRAQKEKDMQTIYQGLEEFTQTAQAELSQLEQSLFNPLVISVQDAINSVGEEHSFTYILDSSTGATVYTGGGTDVTDLVRTKLGL